MLSAAGAAAADFVARLLGGGTFELLVLVVVVVVLAVVAVLIVWLAVKLLIAGAKGLVWLVGAGVRWVQGKGAQRRDRALAALAPVAASWPLRRGARLRSVLAQARRRAGSNALRVVVLGDAAGFDALCAGVGAVAPMPAVVGVVASQGLILIDASRAGERELRRLARALPWKRPLDGVAVALTAGELPSDALSRAATLAGASAMALAVHLVVPCALRSPVWASVGRGANDGEEACAALVRDAVRAWLSSGDSEGLSGLTGQARHRLRASIDRAVSTAPAAPVRISSVALGSSGLVAALTQCASSSVPSSVGAARANVLRACAAGFVVATTLGALSLARQATRLEESVASAVREASGAWVSPGVDVIPDPARVFRIVQSAMGLSQGSGAHLLTPLVGLAPNAGGPRALGAALVEGYVLRPLGTALGARAASRLAPDADAQAWIAGAAEVDEWLAAWEGLSEAPEQVDLAALLASVFGTDVARWPERPESVIPIARAAVPGAHEGGLDVAGATELARFSFVEAMRAWAHARYTDGPVGRAARTVSDDRSTWRERRVALTALVDALSDPAERWVSAPEDSPEYRFEARIYGRSVAMALLGPAVTVQAKAAVSAVRLAARAAATAYAVPGLGPVLVRRSAADPSSGAGTALALSPAAAVWLGVLDALDPLVPAPVLSGDVSVSGDVHALDGASVAVALQRTALFDRLGATPPPGLPHIVFAATMADAGRELESATAAAVVATLRAADPEPRSMGVALADLGELAQWLRGRGAHAQARTVSDVRARAALGVLRMGEEVLEREDPIAVHFDVGADREALLRRFDRGIAALERIEARYGGESAGIAAGADHRLGHEWLRMQRDLAAYARGDAMSPISVLSGRIRAWTDDPHAACRAGDAGAVAGRSDYVARALRAFRVRWTRVCAAVEVDRASVGYKALGAYFETHLAGMWPFASGAEHVEVGAALLGAFVERARPLTSSLSQVEGRHSALFARVLAFWVDPDDPVAVEFRVRWRVRRSEERHAEHLAEITLEGAERDPAGVYRWRYGTPFALRLRLAKDSPWRFSEPLDDTGLERRIVYRGNGGLLRALDDAPSGAALWSLDDALVALDGRRAPLRLSAAFEHRDGRPLRSPAFGIALARSGVDHLARVGSPAPVVLAPLPLPPLLPLPPSLLLPLDADVGAGSD